LNAIKIFIVIFYLMSTFAFTRPPFTSRDVPKTKHFFLSIGTDGLPITNEHPSFSLAFKKELNCKFQIESRLVSSTTFYGLLSRAYNPRPANLSLETMLDFLPSTQSKWELSSGIAAILGKTDGELYFQHEWGMGFFTPHSNESRTLVFLDVGVPFHILYKFKGHTKRLTGLEISGLFSDHVSRVNLGLFWQFDLGKQNSSCEIPIESKFLPTSTGVELPEDPILPVKEELE